MSLIDLANELDEHDQMNLIRDWLRTQGHDVQDLTVTQSTFGITLEWTVPNTVQGGLTKCRDEPHGEQLERLWTYVKIRELQDRMKRQVES